jgi:hypothetical protein
MRGNGRGVGSEEGVGPEDDPVQSDEDVRLEGLVLGCGPDDQVSVGKAGQIGGECECVQSGIVVLCRQLASLESPSEGLGDPAPAGFQRCVADLVDEGLKSFTRAYFGDP